MNKFELINTTLMSSLAAENKTLLIELIMRSDDEGLSWPSVERLCKARGIKHEKNFKGAEVYLEGLVTKFKKGRRNSYVLNVPAIESLGALGVLIKHTDTPAVQGLNNPAVAPNTPAEAASTPAVEGANSSKNNTEDSSEDSSRLATPTEDASRPPPRPSSNYDSPSLPDILSVGATTSRNAPAVEGVSSWEDCGSDWWYAEENNEMEKAT